MPEFATDPSRAGSKLSTAAATGVPAGYTQALRASCLLGPGVVIHHATRGRTRDDRNGVRRSGSPLQPGSRTLRRNSALFSGSAVLMNIPVPSSKPADLVTRGMSERYQWKYLTSFSCGESERIT